MYRSILVPLDGTAFGEQALPLARALAKRTGSSLHLVHVHTPGAASSPIEGAAPGRSGPRPVSQVEDRAYLDRVLGRLAAQGTAPGDAQVLDGPIGRSIAESAHSAGVDLVVMSTHGRTGLGRLWHHDVAGYLTRHLTAPILAVPVVDASPAPASVTELRQVVVPLAGRPRNAITVDEVATFCEATGAAATLLRVIDPPMEVGYTLLGQDAHVNHYLLEDLDDEARREMESAAAELRARGVAVEVAVAHGFNTPDAIVSFARESGADVIVMETHGLGTVRHLFASSVAEDVVHGSHVPVLLHHPTGAAREYADSARSAAAIAAVPGVG